MSDVRPPQYTGHLKRGEKFDTIVGELVDTFGWRLRIEGVRDAENGGYVLKAWLDGEVPKALRQPAIDGESS